MMCAEAVELDQHAVCDEDLAEHKQPLEPLEHLEPLEPLVLCVHRAPEL